jgi:N-acetylmuramoyl-L-alanine amidase
MKGSMQKILAIWSVSILCSTSICYGATKICIDPGHGGSDPGAIGYVEEADIVLDTANKFKNWLDLDTQDINGGSEWDIIMTRSTDAYVSLSARVNYANSKNAKRFISIHANSFSSSSANGSETFCYYSGSSNSFNLRNKTQEELIANGELYNRGNKTAGFYVLKNTHMPAVLTELGFVSNYSDAQSLKDNNWRDSVSMGLMHGLQRHYSLAAHTPVEFITKIVDDNDSQFTSSESWWSSSWSSNKHGETYQVRKTQGISDVATWTIEIPHDGNFRISAWWTSWFNRASNASYIISHSDGNSVVKADQTENGGKWNSLGTFKLKAGVNTVKLSCWTGSGSYVVADAIKWEQVK